VAASLDESAEEIRLSLHKDTQQHSTGETVEVNENSCKNGGLRK
jgi:hypothetical protein